MNDFIVTRDISPEPATQTTTKASSIVSEVSDEKGHEGTAAQHARAEWDALLANSEDVLETLLDESKDFRAARKARKSVRPNGS